MRRHGARQLQLRRFSRLATPEVNRPHRPPETDLPRRLLEHGAEGRVEDEV